jgi:hypothetical protein
MEWEAFQHIAGTDGLSSNESGEEVRSGVQLNPEEEATQVLELTFAEELRKRKKQKRQRRTGC